MPIQRRPLPERTGVRVAPVPDPLPPYDDQALTGPAPFRDARAAPAGASAASTASTGPSPYAPRGRPADAGEWPSRFAQVLAETLAGSRPARQIEPWTTERARAHIRRLGPLLAAGPRPPAQGGPAQRDTPQRVTVHRVLTSHPAQDVVEVAAIVGFGPKTRALAARLERASARPAMPGRPARDARWLCTAIEVALVHRADPPS
jgi:hypothetical protein